MSESTREEMLEMALLMYVTAHQFILSSEGFEAEDERRMSRRYRIAREALEWGRPASDRDLTTDEAKEVLRLGWSDHMADFTDFSEGEMSLLLRWCGMEDHDPFGASLDWTIRAPARLAPPEGASSPASCVPGEPE